MSFEPRELFRILSAHGVRYVVIGNLGATLYGSPLVTNDADICPSRDHDHLEALAGALSEMRARIRAPGVPEGLPFASDAVFDLSFEPSGTGGYGDLSQGSVALPTLRLLLQKMKGQKE